MQIKSILNRFTVADPARTPVSTDADAASSDSGNKVPLLERSELTALFQAVLDEKRRDLPSRRG